MGTFDRKRPDTASDRSPLRGLLDFESISGQALNDGNPIAQGLARLSQLFGLTRFLDLIDGNDDGVFDPAAVLNNFATNVLGGLGVFVKLIGGFVPSFQIPGLDASKIISGLFPRTMVDGLTELISGVTSGVASGIGGAIGGFINAILGFGATPIPAYTANNPIAVSLSGRIAAIEATNTVGLVGFSDHFNDPTLSANWTPVVGTLTVVDGYVFNSGAFGAAYYSAETLATGRWHVQAAVAMNLGAFGGQSRLFGGATTTLSAMYPAAEIDNGGGGTNRDFINLVTLTGPSAGRVQRDSFDVGRYLTSADVIALEYDPNLYSTGVGGYAVFLNGSAVCDWAGADTGTRECGLQLNIQNSFFQGYGWDDFSAYDY